MTLSLRFFKPAVVAAIVSTSLLTAISAQADSLIDIYNKAVTNDPSIREARANMYATMEAKPQARADLLPQLDFSGGWQTNKSDGSRPQPIGGVLESQTFEADTDSLNWSFDLNQTLFRWDQFARMGRADKEVSQAQLDFGAAQQDLMVRVTEAYFNVLAARDSLASEQAAKEAIERQLEQANRRYEVGLIAITDVQEAQAGYDESVAAEILAKRDLANAREALREITGEYNDALAKPAQEIPLVVPQPAIQDEWVRTAQEQNLALLSAKIGADITRDDISISRGGYLPTLDLTASYGSREADSTNSQTVFGTEFVTSFETDQIDTTVGIQFRVPLFAGLGTKADVKQAVYRHRAAKENFEKPSAKQAMLTMVLNRKFPA
jgi:outer membrane protein